MRALIRLILLPALLGPSLVGCGVAGRPLLVESDAATLRSQAIMGPEANEFARSLRSAGWKGVRVSGQKVSAQTPRGRQASFDFSRTRGTGLVILRVDGAVLELPVEGASGAAEELTAALVAISAHMLLGGGEAFLAYWLTHRGEAFDRRECITAVVAGMVLAATTQVPVAGHVLAALLSPIVHQWLERWLVGPRNDGLRGVLQSARALVPAIHKALKQALARR